MAFLKLCDIGKIYSSENNVAVGIRKVNLSFDKGEFVAVTGKSGSGKTTLLNVIGGLDSYEEGEMYIEGKPTSHYIKSDWDEYVAKYVSFIFQDYNILESFTVFENIEFALTSVKDLKERKRRALEIAERVGLKDRLNTKGVKLSGGEKQRTVIARAIAKDSPVILADEPTGNLDSVNAKSILALLKEVSEEKLVIVVTHNYEDVKEYATRHIRIYDGGVESDEKFVEVPESEFRQYDDANYERERQFIFAKKNKVKRSDSLTRKADTRDTLILGWKRFSTRPRQNFLITLILFIAMLGIILSVAYYATVSFTGRNYSSVNPVEGRVLVGGDGQGFTDQQAKELAEKYGAKGYILDDYVMDSQINLLYSMDIIDYDFAYIKPLSECKLSKGRLPQSPDEVAVRVPYGYANLYVLGGEVYPSFDYSMKIVGVQYYIDNRNPMEIYMTSEGYSIYAQWRRFNNSSVYYKTRITDIFGNYTDEEGRATLLIDFSIKDDKVLTPQKSLSGSKTEIYNTVTGVSVSGIKPVYDSKLAEKYENYGSNVFVVGAEKFKEFYSERSGQISLMFGTDKKALAAMEKMQSDGHIVLLSTEVSSLSELTFLDKFINFVSSTLISVVISLALSLIIIVSLIKLFIAGRGDMNIFRTMGIQDRIIKNSSYVQLFLSFAIALLLTGTICIVLYLVPSGWLLPYMGFGAFLSLVISVTAVLVVLASAYNRLLYKNKIKKGLRRANK